MPHIDLSSSSADPSRRTRCRGIALDAPDDIETMTPGPLINRGMPRGAGGRALGAAAAAAGAPMDGAGGAGRAPGTWGKGTPLVVFESTVYPGVTEEVCGPALAEASGLVSGCDFLLGYSPERINPGDRRHTVESIVKIVAGQTPAVTARLARLYGRVTAAGTAAAPDIRTP